MNENSTPTAAGDHPLARWATINEAAEIFRVNPSTCRRWAAQGILRAVRIGKTTLRVDLSSVRYELIGAAA